MDNTRRRRKTKRSAPTKEDKRGIIYMGTDIKPIIHKITDDMNGLIEFPWVKMVVVPIIKIL